MNDIESIWAHQRTFLGQVKARTEPVLYNVQGVEIQVNPGVFPPATDTRLLAENIHVSAGVRTLDLTTGCGIFSVIAGLQGASGIAVDINSEAVKNARENFTKFGVRMEAMQSDLFESVPEELFDQVFANGPFSEGDITDPLDRACYGFRAFLDSLMSGIRTRLKPSGQLLIVTAEWSDLDYFNDTVRKNGLVAKLTEQKSSDDSKRRYNLYQVRIKE